MNLLETSSTRSKERVVEPHTVRPAGVRLRKEQDGRRHTRVWPEGTTRQRDHCIELLLLDQQTAQLLVRLAGAKEHTIRHDDLRPTARLEQPQEERED